MEVTTITGGIPSGVRALTETRLKTFMMKVIEDIKKSIVLVPVRN